MSSRTGSEWLGPLLLASALGLFFIESWRIGPQFDDAYISYRYAANLVDGNGFVFNPGEYVEGYSNLLWTLGIAGGIALGVPAKLCGHLLGLASGAAVLVGVWLTVRALLPARDPVWAGVAAWIVYATPAFERWTVSGMETPLFAALAVCALAAEARGRWGVATVCAALAMLTRPEGALLAASLYGFRFLEHGLRARRVWRDPLIFAGLCVALTGWRLLYYGAPLPNTYYAKVGGVWLGISLLTTTLFLLNNAGLLIAPAVAAAWRTRLAWPGAAFALVFVLYVIYVGGTPRYLTPVVPCLAALGVVGVAGWWRGPVARAASVAFLAATFALAWFGLSLVRAGSPRDLLADNARRRGIAEERKTDGMGEELAAWRVQALRARGERIERVATGGIGAFGFYSGIPIVDILGVIDATVARTPVPPSAKYSLPGHQRSNADYVFSRQPDYILIGNGEGPQQLPDWVPAVQDLLAHPALARDYVWDAEIIGYRRVR